MMKKLISIFICALMLCSVIPANAVETDKSDDGFLYKEKFMEIYGSEAYEPEYKELYYHTQNQAIDWALIYGPSEWVGSVITTAKVCDRFIVSPVECSTFITGYGIYDVAQDQFFDIAYLKEKGYEYEGLAEALAELNIGTTEEPEDDDGVFLVKKKFMEIYRDDAYAPAYDELYYHVKNGDNKWILIYCPSLWHGEVITYTQVCGRTIVNNCEYSTFETGYGIYDKAKDQFIDLVDLKEKANEYKGLAEALAELKIGTKIGDVNGDDVVDVKDVTKLQRFLAEFKTELHGGVIFDTNYDGSININDATHIQRIIAGLV